MKTEERQEIRAKGTVYYDNSAKGNGQRKACWRGEIHIDGVRYRHRSADRCDVEEWLKAVRNGRIKPTDNKADWWRMEQTKDEAVRIEALVENCAEESAMLYDVHKSGDLSHINKYIEQSLLPHMAWYCAHTLHLGQESTLTASRQAVALLLTRIVARRPVMNFTATCKRMLRIYRKHGSFFYYENAPREVRMTVDGIDFSKLAEVWKVTKDKRI